MRLICKHTHNAFKKGDAYEGVEVSNSTSNEYGIMIIREKDQKKFFYSFKITTGQDFIGTWFWTPEEWREKQLKEIGI